MNKEKIDFAEGKKLLDFGESLIEKFKSELTEEQLKRFEEAQTD